MKFCKFIKRLRINRGFSAKSIAEKVNVSLSTYHFWESSRAKPNVQGLLNLEKIFSLPNGTLQKYYCDKDLKRIYVSHPLRNGKTGDELTTEVERNRMEVSKICEDILKKHNDVLVLSPIHAFEFISPLDDQTRAFEQCKALLELADELWVYGDWHASEGCRMEIQYAEILKIPIKYI